MKSTTLPTVNHGRQITGATCTTSPRSSSLTLFTAFGLSLLGTALLQAAPPLPGAIFTSDSTCTRVNVNIYGNRALTSAAQIDAGKKLVYLDGGPARPGAAGLPEGAYYVRVTDPSGHVLLGTSIGSGNDTPFEVDAFNEPLECYQLTQILIKGSDSTPGFDTTPNNGGEYKVWVSTESSFSNTSTKTDNFKIFGFDPDDEPGVSGTAKLNVDKFYDANANGLADPGEVLIDDWAISIVGLTLDTVRATEVCLLVNTGIYEVNELEPVEQDWVHTASLLDGVPQSLLDPVTVALADGSTHTVLFGNLCVGAGGGKTRGFWSNKNGERLFAVGGDLALMVALDLRNANGTHFNPGNYSAFRTWLLAANATNMSFMLSSQMAAMQLNVLNGNVSGSSLIYAPGTNSANPLGFATVNAVMAEANTELGLHGLVLSGSPFRSYQEALKNALDNANNNWTFVQSTPCPFSFAP